MDLADAVLKTPNYLLEKAIDSRRGRDESSQEARERVTSEVSRLFNVFSIANESHTEDVRSEKVATLTEKPQQIFNGLLKKSLRLDEGKVAQQLRLSVALVDSEVVRTHSLVVDESEEGRQDILLNAIVHRNMEQKFTEKVQNSMTGYEEQWKADFGIQKCGSLMRIGKEVLGDSFVMPEGASQVAINQITPTIEANMAQYEPQWRANFGISKYESLAKSLQEKIGEQMPIESADAVIAQIGPTIEAEMKQFEDQWKKEFGTRKAKTLDKLAKVAFENNDQVLEKVSSTLSKFQTQTVAS